MKVIRYLFLACLFSSMNYSNGKKTVCGLTKSQVDRLFLLSATAGLATGAVVAVATDAFNTPYYSPERLRSVAWGLGAMATTAVIPLAERLINSCRKMVKKS